MGVKLTGEGGRISSQPNGPTSERKYDLIVERDVKVRMLKAILLDGNIYRPVSAESFPVFLWRPRLQQRAPIAADPQP